MARYTHRTNILLSDDKYQKLQQLAKKENTSMADLIRTAVEQVYEAEFRELGAEVGEIEPESSPQLAAREQPSQSFPQQSPSPMTAINHSFVGAQPRPMPFPIVSPTETQAGSTQEVEVTVEETTTVVENKVE